ncbi:MAG: hypothetical protein JEZ14_18455 [Marinilabiliaceae bacterium]|nr:hypothetical protein [Marinilabiliaceae bacterium]
MLLENKGRKTEKYSIPHFTIEEGEIVTVFLYGGAHYQEIKNELIDF